MSDGMAGGDSDRRVEYIRVGQDPDDVNPLHEVPLTNRKLDRLAQELGRAVERGERRIASKKRTWDSWRKNWKLEGRKGTKDTPYPGSSNVMTPTTLMTTNAVFAEYMSVFDREPFWSVRAMQEPEIREDFSDRDRAELLQKYMKMLAESPQDLNIPEAKQRIIHEKVLMGNAIVYVPWVVNRRSFMRTLDNGAQERQEMLLHEGPAIEIIDKEDFLFPPEFQDIDDAPWLMHRLRYSWEMLQDLSVQGVYRNVEELEGKGEREIFEGEEEGGFGTPEMVYHLYHGWKIEIIDGEPTDIEFTYHPKSKTFLKLKFNDLGIRPLVDVVHLGERDRFEGMGTGHLSADMQESADSIHNHRIDNMKLVNTRVLAISPTENIGSKERIYPGKVMRLADPHNNINAIQLGDVYPSSLNEEHNSISYAQRATGASDDMAGFANQTAKSGDTAQNAMIRLQQSGSVHGAIAQLTEQSFGRIGQIVFLQLCAHKGDVEAAERRRKRLNEREIQVLTKDVLNIDVGDVFERFRFVVDTTDPDETFEMQRQNLLSLSQLYGQFLERMMPIVQMLYSPQGQQMVQQAPEMYRWISQAVTGPSRLMEESFKLFGFDDAERYVPDYRKEEQMQHLIQAMQRSMSQMGQIGGQNGAGAIQGQQAGGQQGGQQQQQGQPTPDNQQGQQAGAAPQAQRRAEPRRGGDAGGREGGGQDARQSGRRSGAEPGVDDFL